jgi:hypothetical protein
MPRRNQASPRAASPSVGPLIRRVQGEFLEMPGLCLTQAQACRLWGLEPDVCATILETLCKESFLARASSGGYRLARG